MRLFNSIPLNYGAPIRVSGLRLSAEWPVRFAFAWAAVFASGATLPATIGARERVGTDD